MNKINDLRTFLEVLEKNNLLVKVNKEVDWKYEIGSVLATLEGDSQKSVVFNKVKDKEFTVCGNVLVSMDGIALALGCDKSNITNFLADCLEKPIKPKIVEYGVCQETIITGSDIDLDKIPVPIHAPKDGGPIITSGVIVSKSLNNPTQNLSFQRMHVKGKDKFSIMINEWRHLKEFYDEAESEGKPLPIAVVIGADPVVYIGAGLRYDGDEMEIASSIRKEPIEVVKCITSDIYVPASAIKSMNDYLMIYEEKEIRTKASGGIPEDSLSVSFKVFKSNQGFDIVKINFRALKAFSGASSPWVYYD